MDKRAAIKAELPHLMRYARALTRDREAADDLVQDCVHRALGRLHLFAAGTNMRAWLFTVLHNIHRQDQRRARRRPDAAQMDDSFAERFGAPPTQTDALRLRDLDRAMARLPEDQRQVVLLVGLEEMSYRQAAEVLDIPVGTVMSRLARGRERLRRLMDGEAEPMLKSVK